MANVASAAGIATRRSRSGCVITSPKLRSGVPDSQLNTNGISVSGVSRTSRSSRIHDQLLATVVRTTVVTLPSPACGGGTASEPLIVITDAVLDRLGLRHD